MRTNSIRPRIVIRTVLLTILVAVPTLFSAYCYVNRDRIFPARGSIVVYGRESCGITRMVRNDLAEMGIPYVFADVNVSAIHDELRYKLGPNFNEPTYTYPVVHVGGKILLTPTAEQIQRELSVKQERTARDYSTFLNGADPVPHY
ncbi:glutaredoxin family protein [Undibacterium sp. SXout7W]|uniref:glutaredoxin family protein n=1 Tax=Undibacterium sp. SXout7W TaxID=3413049 RepID=UPI003BF149A0